MTVRRVPGVPDWFVKLLHRWERRRCHRIGHVGPMVPRGVCTHCGWVHLTPEDPVVMDDSPFWRP